MAIGDEIVITDWFILEFVENRGMAFGLELFGKLFLSVFRILAVIGIAWWLRNLTRQKAPGVVIISVALIFAGALGNIIDSAFYGLLFGDSNGQVAEFMPQGGGYAPFLYGNVVDMLHFPIASWYWPDWVPFVGGTYQRFFSAIFNIADTSISIGVVLLIIYQRKAFPKNPVKKEDEETQENPFEPTETVIANA